MSEHANQSQQGSNQMSNNPADVRAFIMKHRVASFAATATIITVTTIGIATAQGMTSATNDQKTLTTHEKRAEGKTSTTTTTVESSAATDAHDTANSRSTAPKTNVVVNGQTVHVPENGTVSQSINNGDGTTRVEVSNSGNGTSFSSSTITSNTGSSTNISSNSMNVTTSNSP